jgi:hypothetical protein
MDIRMKAYPMHQIRLPYNRPLSRRVHHRPYFQAARQVMATLQDIGQRRFLLGLGREERRDLYFEAPTNCEPASSCVAALQRS